MPSCFLFGFFLANYLLFKGPLIIFLLYSILCDHWTASRHNPISFIFYLCLLMNSLSLKALNNSSLFIVVSPLNCRLIHQNSHLLHWHMLKEKWILISHQILSWELLKPRAHFLEPILVLGLTNKKGKANKVRGKCVKSFTKNYSDTDSFCHGSWTTGNSSWFVLVFVFHTTFYTSQTFCSQSVE